MGSMNLLRALEGLILPTQCVGCGRWDVALCCECAALARMPPDSWGILEGESWGAPEGGREGAPEGEAHRGDLPLWSLGEYDGPVRSILLAAKHRDRADTDVFMWEAGRTLGRSMSQSSLLGEWEELWVVPAPSQWRRRWNGREVALMLGRGVAQGIYEGRGGRVRLVQACALRWGVGSQAGRSGGERRRGRAGTMRLRVELPSEVRVVVVDDVVTTGATIREMGRLLGAQVLGVGALCRVGR